MNNNQHMQPQEKETEISQLGEFGLIHHLTDGIEPKNSTTLKGIGDDAAILTYPDTDVVVSTDLLLEGVHFDLTYVPLKHLGYKSAVVNISDICAMNATPRQITVRRHTPGLSGLRSRPCWRRYNSFAPGPGYIGYRNRRCPTQYGCSPRWRTRYRPYMCKRRFGCGIYGAAGA